MTQRHLRGTVCRAVRHVGGQPGGDGLVETLNVPLAKGNSHERGHHALRHRLRIERRQGACAAKIPFVNEPPAAYDEQRANLWELALDAARRGGKRVIT
jgi:hypothetical protein